MIVYLSCLKDSDKKQKNFDNQIVRQTLKIRKEFHFYGNVKIQKDG